MSGLGNCSVALTPKLTPTFMWRLVWAGVDLLERVLKGYIFHSVRLGIQREFIRVLPLEPFKNPLFIGFSPRKDSLQFDNAHSNWSRLPFHTDRSVGSRHGQLLPTVHYARRKRLGLGKVASTGSTSVRGFPARLQREQHCGDSSRNLIGETSVQSLSVITRSSPVVRAPATSGCRAKC